MGADTVGITVGGLRGRIIAAGGSTTEIADPPALVAGFRVGVQAQPPDNGPRSDPGADWMDVDTYYPPFIQSSTRDIYVRSQRKCEELGQTLYLCWDRRDATTDSVYLHADLSILLLLP